MLSQAWTKRTVPTRLRTSDRRSHSNDRGNIGSHPSHCRLADGCRNRSRDDPDRDSERSDRLGHKLGPE